jgi:HEAT repeat protein
VAVPRIGRWWIIASGSGLALIQVALVVLWWKLPEWAPRWTMEHAPVPEMALRAMRQAVREGIDVNESLEPRLLSWGTAIGPALRRQFAVGDHEHRLDIVFCGNEVAQALAEVVPDVPSVRWQGRIFSPADIRELREDLYGLVLAAVAEGSSNVPSNAAFLSLALKDPRVVPHFCAFLRGKKTPLDADLEPVVYMLGAMADASAVPALIPLLPIRHKAHPKVEEALARCLDEASVAQVVGATRHAHEVVRTWAAQQFPRYRGSADFAARIVALVDDPERQVSIAAIRAIAETRLAAAGAALLRLAGGDGDPEPRRFAIEALGTLAHTPAGALLRALAQAPDEPLRGPAITALAALGDQADTALLIPLLRETEPGIAALARAALERRTLSAEQRQQLDETK